jgi:hypothetical protein
MSLLKSIGNFLFGKDPDIFDNKGEVRHNLPETKWKEWDDRIRSNPNFDFRFHKGQAKETQPGEPSASDKH